MARLPRVVIVDVPHHVTQRGNARQAIFSSDSDRLAYLALLRQHCERYHLSLLGYCLTGRPLGAAPFVAHLEQATLRLLAPRKRGRRQKPVAETNQPPISFVA